MGKYDVPRKARKTEKPQEGRSELVQEARLKLMKNMEKVIELAEKLKPEVDEHNTKIEATFKKKIEEVKKKKKKITEVEFRSIYFSRSVMLRNAFKEAYYGTLAKSAKAPMPDVDTISPFSIEPGMTVELDGTDFGPSQGKVLLEITPARGVVELQVSYWTEIRVWAALSRYISGLRPYYGRIWLKTGDGRTSNAWPMQFNPLYTTWEACEAYDCDGGAWGKKCDDVALDGYSLNDPDFSIESVTREHVGDGWSEFRWPNAGGQNVAQGYHIGESAWNSATMFITWRLRGPVGLAPPFVDGLLWLPS